MSKIFFKFAFAVSIFFSSVSARADLASEFGLSLSKTTVNRLLANMPSEFKIENEPIELTREGVFKDLNYSTSTLFLDANINFKFDKGSDLSAHADVKSAGVVLRDFSFTQITEVKRTGVNARVTTRVTCTELTIALNDWTVDLSNSIYFKNGRLILDRESGTLETQGEQVSIDLSRCSAPKGVDLILRDMLLDWIDSVDGNTTLFSAVLDYGQTYIDDEFEKLKSALNMEVLEKKIDLAFESISFSEDKVEAVGVMTAASKNRDYTLTVSKADFESAKTKADIILPKHFFSILVPDFMKETSVDFEVTRADVPEAESLFKKRFLQFFVWRDLLNFKKSSNFVAGVSLKPKQIKLKSIGSSFKYMMGGDHRIDMDFLNSNGSRYPYIDFTGRLAADLSLRFADTGVFIGVTEPELKAKAKWDPDMKSWRKSKAKGKPWMSVLLPRIKKALKNTTYAYSWEDLGLGEYIKKAKMYKANRSVLISVSLK